MAFERTDALVETFQSTYNWQSTSAKVVVVSLGAGFISPSAADA